MAQPRGCCSASSLRFQCDQIAHRYAAEIFPDAQYTAFGISPKISLSEYRADPLCFLSFFDYKVDTQVVTSRYDESQVLIVINTSAGPDIIRADTGPSDTLAKIGANEASIRNRPSVGRRRNIRMPVHRRGRLKYQSEPADLHSDRGCICPHHSAPSTGTVHREFLKSNMVGRREPVVSNVLHQIRRQWYWLRLHYEAKTTQKPPLLHEKKKIASVNGHANITLDKLRRLHVEKFSNAEVTIPKDMNIENVVLAPVNQNVLAIIFESDELYAEDNSSNGQSLGTKITAPKGGGETAAMSVDDIDLSELGEEQKAQLRNLLQPFAFMW